MAVADLDEAIHTYERLYGATLELRERNEEQGVEAAYVRVGTGRVELLAATGDDTPVGRFLAKRGPGMHHVALAVADVGAALSQLTTRGAVVIDDRSRDGVGGHEVAFVHPDSQHGVLVEVVSEHER
jgi:methylmalonyl-CoA epimerase